MHQDSLFHDSAEEALDTTIKALGGYKGVGHDLWPAMKIDSAKSRLSSCLNPEKNEKLTPTEIETIALWGKEKKNVHHYAVYLMRALGYEDPKPVNIESETLKAQREFVECAERMEQMMARITRLKQQQ